MCESALDQTQETAERKVQENLHIVEIGNVRKGLDKAKKEMESACIHVTSTTLRAKITQIKVQYNTLQAHFETLKSDKKVKQEGVQVTSPSEAKGGGKVGLRPFTDRVPQS